MKNYLSKFMKWTLSLVLVASLGACTEDNANTDSNPSVDGITISNVNSTYNTVTFDVEAKDAVAIAYIAIEKGTSITAADIFNYGEAKGSTSGTFTCKGANGSKGLNPDTDYVLYVAARSSKTYGNVGPATYSFRTTINDGAPATPKAAGIRVADLGTNSLKWEVTNGSQVDFSITMVESTVIMENEAYEAAKQGISEADCITKYLTSTDNAYLCRVTEGANESAIYDYEEVYTTYYTMLPDANYTIYTIGCEGDYESGDYVTLDFTKKNIRTEAFVRKGNPYVEVSHVESYTTGILHHLKPNKDTKYWTKFYAPTASLTEYVNYYDSLNGDGAGKARLREFIQHVDPYVNKQSGETDISMNLYHGLEGIDYSRLALGFDENFMPGDEYGESVDQVLSVDQSTPDGEYSIAVENVGATTFNIKVTMEGNCRRVYLRLCSPSNGHWYEEDDLTVDSDGDGITDLAADLDYQGYAVFRKDDEGTECFDTKGETYVANEFFIEASDTKFQILAVSMNYDLKLGTPELGEIFNTKPLVKGDFEPSLQVSNGGTSKTNILVKYTVDQAKAKENGEVIFYHRFIDSTDSLFVTDGITDPDRVDWLIKNDGYDNANCWTLGSNDSADANAYEYYFNWAAMIPGTTYEYIYCTENRDGEVSHLGQHQFITANNDGGDNPNIEFKYKEDSYAYNEEKDEMDIEFTVDPNNDIVEYTSLYMEESSMTSYGFTTDTDENIHWAIYRLFIIGAQGIPAIDDYHFESKGLDAGNRVWLVAQGRGANKLETPVYYVCFYRDAETGELVIDEKKEFSLDEYRAPGTTVSNRSVLKVSSSPFTSVSRIESNYNTQNRSMIQPASVLQNRSRVITEEEAAELRANGIEFYTMRELTRKAILKEKLKK